MATVPPPGINVIFGTTPENSTADVAAVRITTNAGEVPGILMTSATSAITTLEPLLPLMVLDATALSTSFRPQLKPSSNLKTIVSPMTGPEGLEPLTVPVIATPVPQAQEN